MNPEQKRKKLIAEIDAIRKEKKISHTKLAEMLNKDRQYIQRFFKSDNSPGIDSIIEILTVLEGKLIVIKPQN